MFAEFCSIVDLYSNELKGQRSIGTLDRVVVGAAQRFDSCEAQELSTTDMHAVAENIVHVWVEWMCTEHAWVVSNYRK
jgi:hypothetical protein